MFFKMWGTQSHRHLLIWLVDDALSTGTSKTEIHQAGDLPTRYSSAQFLRPVLIYGGKIMEKSGLA